jgi:S-adenosylmethionine:tRNA ribosyltransferase-isomerase
MKTSDFDYHLPEELIAQTPLPRRDASRMMRVSRGTGEVSHHIFSNLPEILRPGDLLIMNDSRVIPARLMGNKLPGGAVIQFLLLNQKSADTWEILTKPGRKAIPDARFVFGANRLHAEILAVLDDGIRLARFDWPQDMDFFTLLDEIGELPLPEYIHDQPEDKERYQTVYNREPGSAAAPTAGLHFTPELLGRLRESEINHAFITLHVGLGTFRPVKAQDIAGHIMHRESFHIPAETAELIAKTKRSGGRVIAVGTTACRTLESRVKDNGEMLPGHGSTDIFICPGHDFKIIDGLITNFHLPQSTLIMLVSAFAGYEATMAAYRTAVEECYRFYSFGDAMLIM